MPVQPILRAVIAKSGVSSISAAPFPHVQPILRAVVAKG